MIEPRPELSKLSDYVPGKSIDEIRERYGLDKVVKLASNENPLGASPKAVEAFHKIADSLHLYPRGDVTHIIPISHHLFYSIKGGLDKVFRSVFIPIKPVVIPSITSKLICLSHVYVEIFS